MTVSVLKKAVAALTLGSIASLIPLVIFLIFELPDKNWVQLMLLIPVPIYLAISFCYLLFILLPIHFFLVRSGRVRWWIYVLAGLVVGLAILLGVDSFTGGWSTLDEYLLVAVTGSVTSIVFWYVLRPVDAM